MALTSRLSVGIVVEGRYRTQRQPTGLHGELIRRGHAVRLIDPLDVCTVGDAGWLQGLDVLVPRGRSLALLALVSCAERHDVPVVNGRSAIGAVHNKLEMAGALIEAGVPTPQTFAAPIDGLAGQVPRRFYPLVLKPTFGDNGLGLVIVDAPEELAGVEWHEPVAIAQQLVSSDGTDLKLYGIGDEVWAIRKPSPLLAPASSSDGGQPVGLTSELLALGRRCGELFGLDLYGADCVETPRGPLVIEVNEFPNYTGVVGADERLADLVERTAAA
jgi:ribosomal protein S6--L-glutamate ligase